MNRRHGIWMAFALAACGGGSSESAHGSSAPGGETASSGSSSAERSGSGTIAIVPLTLQSTDASGATHSAELGADGTLTVNAHAVARIDGARIVSPSGDVLLSLTPDGHVEMPGHPSVAQITDRGEIVGQGTRIVVNPDGSVEERRDDGQTRTAPFHFASMPPNARRTAAVIVALMLAPTDSAAQSSGDTAATATTSSSLPSSAPASAAPASPPPTTATSSPQRGHTGHHHH